jgi:FtsP/CotA-like multicopper oxidase with cupredoxin domain
MRFDFSKLSRREIFKLSMMSGTATLIGARSALGQGATCSAMPPMPYDIEIQTGLGALEAFPISPFILHPFNDPLPVPTAMKPGYRQSDGTLTPTATNAWYTRQSTMGRNTVCAPGPGAGMQDSMGKRKRTAGVPGAVCPDAGTHQLWTDGSGASGTTGGINVPGFPLPDPICYHIRVQVNKGKVTTSDVQPVDKSGRPIQPPANVRPDSSGRFWLPDSTIYGFNGTFPGPMINAEYGKPVLVRFENDLDLNPLNLDRQDFGAPDWAFLTHLHNGHTAPESDGNPHHMTDNKGGYQPGQWVDNLYLNYPAGNDPCEKQSFFWFHDHRMHHTGANVYKGMVGLFPIYDPVMDNGDETQGCRLPGVRTNNADGSFDVKYDIPMALYDCLLDNGTTPHQDYHNGCGEFHPEWWGQKFFRHFPDHGFVGDIFTINGVAYPRLDVYQRQYRFRFLGASVARDYELMLMRGTPTAAPGTQGQWQLPDGQQCMKWTQVAAEGGLLPKAISRDSCQIWPAKRREFVVDFTRYMDGSPTKPGDVVYLVNVLEMPDGRKPNFNPPGATKFYYKVPMMKIVIGGAPPEKDNSMPVADLLKATLRPMPQIPANMSSLPQRKFTLQRGSAPSGETQWLINGLEFSATAPLALPKRGAGEVWTIENGGGGWTHPMHLHMEEHTVLKRTNSTNAHPDDTGKEDVIALDPAEEVTLFRRFRTFAGNYVAHCHNLAHEDHNMMFGWSIVP